MKTGPRRLAAISAGSRLRAAFAVAVVAAAGLYVAAGARQQWDFETYYFAGSAFRAGLNPYSLHDLSRLAGRAVELPFIYPPVTLALFVPLSVLPIAAAAAVWLGAKCLLLALLVWIWRRDFLRDVDPALLVPTTLLGFEMSALWDLRTGNVALIEAALLTVALSSYLRHRTALAAYLTALAGVFKLLPATLLALILLTPRPARERAGLVAGGLAFLAAAVSFPIGLAADWRSALIHSPPSARVMGGVNPSGLGLADWLLTATQVPPAAVPYAALAAYLVFVAAVLTGSLEAVRRARAGSRLEQAMLVVLLWLMVSPRLMVYSFTMAIPPVLFAIQTRIRSEAWRWAAASLVMVQGVIRLLPGQPPPMLGVASFLILVAAWALLVRSPSAPGWRSEAPAAHSPSPVPR